MLSLSQCRVKRQNLVSTLYTRWYIWYIYLLVYHVNKFIVFVDFVYHFNVKRCLDVNIDLYICMYIYIYIYIYIYACTYIYIYIYCVCISKLPNFEFRDLQPNLTYFSQDYHLALHTTHVPRVNFIREWRDL